MPMLYVSKLKSEPEDFEPLEMNFEKFNFKNIDNKLLSKFLADIIDHIGGYMI